LKKFVSGIVVGLLLFSGASVFADSTSLIGQKVQGLFSVEKDGVKVADAVIINGSTYAPIRAVSEATGANLSVDGKKIIISDKEDSTVDQAIQAENTNLVQDAKKQRQIDRYNGSIKTSNEDISSFEALLKKSQEDLANAKTDGEVKAAKESIEYIQIRLKEARNVLADAEARLAELQAQ
jgi:hypothetical protein